MSDLHGLLARVVLRPSPLKERILVLTRLEALHELDHGLPLGRRSLGHNLLDDLLFLDDDRLLDHLGRAGGQRHTRRG